MHIKSLAMLTVASVPSVHRLQRSLLLTFANASVCWPVSIFRTLSGSQNLQRLLTAWPSGSKLQSTLSLRGAFYPKCWAKNDELALSKSTGSETGESFQAPAYDGLCTKAKDHSEEERREIYESFSAPFLKQRSEVWTRKKWNSELNMRKKIFCNRSLNMNSIVAVGFDMDYTLGQYQPDAFESLAYHGTAKKLVFDLGYPRELLEWNFDWQYMLRGLVLDKKRGNILKMDRHKYVKVAYHGFREMSRDDRMATYCNTLSRESYDEPDYALIDTLFSLPEAYLFAQLVEFKDSSPDKFPAGTDYAPIYRDVRAAVDLCHRDGTLKQAVAQNPSKYIRFDSELVPMLKMLRNSGRMTFLVTNSLWDYTHVVMNYLCGKCGTDGGTPRDDEWLQFFDLVLTGSAKPSFFADGNRAPLYEVDIRTGMLQNTDNGSPLAQIGDRSMSQCSFAQKEVKQACRVFQGGNVAHLHRLIGIEAGAQVLYVGDHIYGDILRSKKDLGWRTMLIVPELEKELELFHQTVGIRKEFRLLRQKREILDDKIQQLKWPLRFNSHSEEDLEKLRLEISALEVERDKVRELHRQAQRVCHQKYHKTWGQLMKTGYQNSRFAHQVERFACLYTSQVTNLCYYSPDKSYRTIEDIMPHELQDIDL